MLNVNIDEVTFVNDGRKILSDLKFNLTDNSVFSILGKNGSGKSTLLKSLTGLLDNRFYKIKGEVYFENINLLSCKVNVLKELRKNKIKYVFQDAVNSFDHLRTFKYYFEKLNANEADVDELLDFFILPERKDIYNLFPYEVSGGMAQRISFILALLSDPGIILLDEPTSGIDPAIANLFLIKIEEFIRKRGNSIILITQDFSFAEKISTKIAYLSEGKLSGFLTIREFYQLKKPDVESFIKSSREL
jgi:peptide/nickel transport system ATP-binding protein